MVVLKQNLLRTACLTVEISKQETRHSTRALSSGGDIVVPLLDGMGVLLVNP